MADALDRRSFSRGAFTGVATRAVSKEPAFDCGVSRSLPQRGATPSAISRPRATVSLAVSACALHIPRVMASDSRSSASFLSNAKRRRSDLSPSNGIGRACGSPGSTGPRSSGSRPRRSRRSGSDLSLRSPAIERRRAAYARRRSPSGEECDRSDPAHPTSWASVPE